MKTIRGPHAFAPENSMKRMGVLCCCVLTLVLLAVPLLAQQSPPSPASTTPTAGTSKDFSDKLGQLEKKVADAQSSADNAWMLASAALVLLMTGPGLALFYGGLVRQKNVLAIMMQSFALMVLITYCGRWLATACVLAAAGRLSAISSWRSCGAWARFRIRITPRRFRSPRS
jgi:hypothetical protein